MLNLGARDRIRRKVATILDDWIEPHGTCSMIDRRVLRAVDVSEDGLVRIAIRPTRPHSPVILLNLIELRERLLKERRIKSVMIRVLDVPDEERWTRAVNAGRES